MHSCPVCGRSFSSYSGLHYHLLVLILKAEKMGLARVSRADRAWLVELDCGAAVGLVNAARMLAEAYPWLKCTEPEPAEWLEALSATKRVSLPVLAAKLREVLAEELARHKGTEATVKPSHLLKRLGLPRGSSTARLVAEVAARSAPPPWRGVVVERSGRVVAVFRREPRRPPRAQPSRRASQTTS